MSQRLTQKIVLEDGEEIVKILRKHWFILFAKIFFPIVVFFVPFIFLPFITSQEVLGNVFASAQNLTQLTVFASALWALLIWVSIWTSWMDWYLDMWTVTNRRVIAINQKGLFQREIASFRYERLQDLSLEINGIIATFLDFGNIQAETAGQGDSEFNFRGVPQPREVKALILRVADARVQSQRDTNSSPTSDDGV